MISCLIVEVINFNKMFLFPLFKYIEKRNFEKNKKQNLDILKKIGKYRKVKLTPSQKYRISDATVRDLITQSPKCWIIKNHHTFIYLAYSSIFWNLRHIHFFCIICFL